MFKKIRAKTSLRKLFVVLMSSVMSVQSALPETFSQLPDLGDSSQVDFSPMQERKIGEQIMRQIRADKDYLDDSEIEDYLNALGRRLVSVTSLRGQSFTFFVLRDPSINAFAMPGGFIGVHTGLLTAAQTESELASVLAHEIGHVEQHHIARSLALQKNATLTVLASILAAVLISRVSSQGAEAAIATGIGASAQNQLSYSRDFEREADRVGFRTLEKAGFDVHGMPDFFGRMEKFNSFNDLSSFPSYLRTHPLTSERIADMQARASAEPYRQVVDSLEFTLVRAKLDSENGLPYDVIDRAKARLENNTAEKAFKRYELTRGYLRANRLAEAKKAFESLRELKLNSAMIEALSADIARAQGKPLEAARICHSARARYLESKTLVYCEADAYLAGNKPKEAEKLMRDQIALNNRDERLYTLLANAYGALDEEAAQHRAVAEVYVLRGNLPAAIDQLQLAQRSREGNYYEQSAMDARLRELREQELEARKDQE